VHETIDLLVANIHFEVIARLIEKKCFNERRTIFLDLREPRKGPSSMS